MRSTHSMREIMRNIDLKSRMSLPATDIDSNELIPLNLRNNTLKAEMAPRMVSLTEIATDEFEAVPDEETASRLGMSKDELAVLRCSDDYKRVRGHLTTEIRGRAQLYIQTLSLSAVGRLGELLASENEQVALKAATVLIKSAGLELAGKLDVAEKQADFNEFTDQQIVDNFITQEILDNAIVIEPAMDGEDYVE